MIVEYMIREGKPIIHILYTDMDGLKHHEEVDDFVPYFYVPHEEHVPNIPEIRGVEEGEYYSIFGGKVKKVYTFLPSQVRDIRDKFSKTYEADVLFPTRYTIDKIDKIKGKLRVVTLDIEVDDSDGMPDVELADKEILAVGVKDSQSDMRFCFYWRLDLENKLFKRDIDGKEIVCVSRNTEKGMLEELISWIRKINPEVIVVWNFKKGLTGFDIPYLLRRMNNIGVDSNLLSPLNYVDADREKIHGVVVFDLLAGYRKLMLKEMRTFKLDYVAEVELGKRKIPHEESIYEMWKDNIDKLVEYNMNDVELTDGINQKRNVLGLYDEIRRITSVDLGRVLQYSTSADCALLSYCKGKYVLPTKTGKREKKRKIKGAEVLKPARGLYKNVIVCDLSRSYPSAMISCNISPETYSKNGDIIISPELRFVSSPKGIVPSVLGDLIDLRKDKKKQMKQFEYGTEEYNMLYNQQFALKSLINTFYGALAFKDFRLYDQRVASAVTDVGRKLINWCIKIAKDNNYNVVYGDTDSIFVEAHSEQVDSVVEEGQALKEKICKSLDDFALGLGVKKHVFDLDFEKVFSSILFTEAKKRYAGKLSWLEGKKTDKLKIVGFDSVRSDVTKVSKKVQENLFMIVTSGQKLRVIQESAYNYLREEIENIKNKKYPIADIAFPTAIHKAASEYESRIPTVRAMENSAFIGKDYKPGDKPLMIPLKKVPRGYPPMDVIFIDDEKDLKPGFVIDYDRIIQKSVLKKVEDILPSIGLSIEEVLSGKKQSSLL